MCSHPWWDTLHNSTAWPPLAVGHATHCRTNNPGSASSTGARDPHTCPYVLHFSAHQSFTTREAGAPEAGVQ